MSVCKETPKKPTDNTKSKPGEKGQGCGCGCGHGNKDK